MGLSVLVLGLVLFLGSHSFVPHRDLRALVVARLGEGGYKLLFSLPSAIGLILIIYGFRLYRGSHLISVWYPPAVMRHVAAALMWPAIVCVAAAYVPGGIKKTLKHPMLVGVKLWALAHLLANGDLGGILLFGSFLVWAVYDRITLKRRTDPGAPNIPIGDWKNDLGAVAIGTLVYFAIGFVFHPAFGLPVFGG
jgi:uncharacterized membrane protein